MGYQFIHMESFSRKADSKGRSVEFILSEASRKTASSIHVANPLPPIVIYGLAIDALREVHDDEVAAAVIQTAGGKSRKIRRDQKTLHTVVASHPATMEETRASSETRLEVEEWERRTIKWLHSQYGENLKTVIRHEDESHWHVHAYVLPDANGDWKATKFHPGVTAKREEMTFRAQTSDDGKALNKFGDSAYKRAMRIWQDSYHETVGIPSGLTRLGPQRRRLNRDEWQREQSQAQALKKAIERAYKVKESGDGFVARTKIQAERVRVEALKQLEVARLTNAAALASESSAQRKQSEAAVILSDVRHFSGVGGRLRALWDGLSESKIATRIKREFADEIDRVQTAIKNIQDSLKAEQKRRREAEQEAVEARKEARAARAVAVIAVRERDRAWSLLPIDKRPKPVIATPSMVLTPKLDKRDR
ncbi:hypothetical protein J5289_21715 [Rhizobium sp. B230/85]|uniref:hypothetical protein n=1 Tax=unclassified Rhizobium TaxID=2613769 RepID=UPI001ADA6D15|nr:MULTISPECIES: hypothetical protein [unclassified Rhizobium]MBO9135153.1 hypothetical protein [Rhizobium sp. B209b/85]QXZ97942.1 hypothetical protein J5289_21715 [Rhizobium sp. B230/85]